MRTRGALFLVALLLTVGLVACGRKQGPTPVPTLPGATVIPLTPTAAPSVPALPKYLPTPAQQPQPTPQRAEPTQAEPTQAEPATEVVTIGVTPTVVEPRVEVVVSEAHAYNGPGETFVPIGIAHAGDQLIVEERSPDGKWLHTCCFAGRPGWIALKDVRPLTSLDDVPVATNLPAAPGTSPLATPTPGE